MEKRAEVVKKVLGIDFISRLANNIDMSIDDKDRFRVVFKRDSIMDEMDIRNISNHLLKKTYMDSICSGIFDCIGEIVSKIVENLSKDYTVEDINHQLEAIYRVKITRNNAIGYPLSPIPYSIIVVYDAVISYAKRMAEFIRQGHSSIEWESFIKTLEYNTFKTYHKDNLDSFRNEFSRIYYWLDYCTNLYYNKIMAKAIKATKNTIFPSVFSNMISKYIDQEPIGDAETVLALL